MQKQNGFSLIEVLVTLVIISLGLLGIAGVIVNGLKNNQSSYARTQASVLANDIIDRMRANRTTAETSPYAYNLALGASPTGSGVVLNDLTQWRASLASAMPSGTGSVTMADATKVTIVVQWDDSRASSDAPTNRAATTTTVGRVAQQIKVETRL